MCHLHLWTIPAKEGNIWRHCADVQVQAKGVERLPRIEQSNTREVTCVFERTTGYWLQGGGVASQFKATRDQRSACGQIKGEG